jgi:transcriptional regulator with XRE-family HTH domain
VSTNRQRPSELGAFLQTRRAHTRPDQVGLPSNGQRRRVAGLRREEVAQLAMISTDYYTRLEQGRLIGASTSVLDAIARALRLRADETSYLFQLANKNISRPRRRPAGRVRPQIQVLLDNLIDSPALALGPCLDVLAWNSLAAALFTDFARIPDRERNFVRLLFLEPAVRGRYVDWEDIARTCVAFFRMAVLDAADDPRLTELVGDLSVHDADFRTWWASRDVDYQTFGTKTLVHPLAGEMTLDWQLLRPAHDGQEIIMVMTAPPAGRTREALRLLQRDGDVARSG